MESEESAFERVKAGLLCAMREDNSSGGIGRIVVIRKRRRKRLRKTVDGGGRAEEGFGGRITEHVFNDRGETIGLWNSLG